MADTSFRFGAENDENILSSDEEDLDFEEEEYDAFNDETFGTSEDIPGLDDWEEQHEHFAELTESSRQNKFIENSLNKLGLKESNLYPTAKDSVWSYKETNQNGDLFNSPILPKVSSYNVSATSSKPLPMPSFANVELSKISDGVLTLEEIERNLLQNRPKLPPSNHNVAQPSLAQIPLPHPPGRYPPGFPLPPHAPPPPPPPLLATPLPHPHMQPVHHGAPGMVRLTPPSHYMHHRGNQQGPAPPPPGFYPPNPHFPIHHPINFPPPMRLPPPPLMHNMIPHPNMHNLVPLHNHNDHHRRNYYNNTHNRGEPYDEYAGIMSNREKQWLINIQLVQLNTGTPYFDDYYYTIFKERKLKNIKENQGPHSERVRRQSIRRNSEREGQNTLTPKVYTPLQFENSLGKLQCGSVTAPRKIIDMDIVTPDKENELNSNLSKDTKKTKQLLLELETLYNYILKSEDLTNPLYKTNMEKLYEIKQKQKLRELEFATTTEQKQEILKSLREDSEPFDEDPQEYLIKVVNGFFQEDKYVYFLNIRKGKMLLLRILPYLTNGSFSTYLCDLWIKVFLSIPMVGRKDASGDNLFIKLYPFFKRFIQISDMDIILDIISNLLEVRSSNVSRGTPIVFKQLLSFIVANKFGVSALVAIFMKIEQLISSTGISDGQQRKWFNFVVSWAESLLVPKVVLETPIEYIPTNIFNEHCTHITNLTEENKNLLEKWLTNCS